MKKNSFRSIVSAMVLITPETRNNGYTPTSEVPAGSYSLLAEVLTHSAVTFSDKRLARHFAAGLIREEKHKQVSSSGNGHINAFIPVLGPYGFKKGVLVPGKDFEDDVLVGLGVLKEGEYADLLLSKNYQYFDVDTPRIVSNKPYINRQTWDGNWTEVGNLKTNISGINLQVNFVGEYRFYSIAPFHKTFTI